MKIFKMNDCDWYAAETPEEALQAMVDNTGYEDVAALRTETKADPVELTEAELDQLMFVEADENDEPTEEKVSFRKHLAEMIENQEEFPCMFASTEY